MMKIFKLFLFIVGFLLTLSNELIAQDCETGNAAVWIPVRTYDQCNSRLTLRIHTHRGFFPVNNTTTVNGVNVSNLELISSAVSTTPGAFNMKFDYTVYVYRIPSDLFDANGRIHVYHRFTWADCGSGMRADFYQKEFDAEPTNLNISKGDHCDKIGLNWNNPSNPISCSDNLIKIDIDRKLSNSSEWINIDRLPFPSTNYEDVLDASESSIQKEEEYDYRVRYVHSPFYAYIHYSQPSTAQGGYAKKSPPKPFDVNASNDNCEDAVSLTWQWNGQLDDLSGFRIERRLNQQSSQWESLTTTGSDVRMYNDAQNEYNTEYLYRIFALNSCDPQDISEPSTEVIGIKPGTPPEPDNLTISKSNSSITVNWESPGQNTTGFIIERTRNDGGSSFISDVLSKNIRSFTDLDVEQCVTYNYKVRAVSICYPFGFGSQRISELIEQDLSTVFDTDGTGFEASTGYFSNKVELTWKNNNSGQTNQVRIYRRVLGSNTSSSLLAALNDDSGIYNDNSAEAGVIYEYEIQAEGPCENITSLSNKVRAVGFRSKSGQVTGNVSYTGGIAVKDVKIIATRDDIVIGKSISLNGGSLSIPHNTNQELSNNMLLEAWVKPQDYNSNFTFIGKQGSYHLGYDHNDNTIKVSVHTSNIDITEVDIPKDSLALNQWSHVAAQVANDSLYLIINGIPKKGVAFNGVVDINDTSSPIVIGQGLNGNVKEVRLWNKYRSKTEIEQQHSAYASGSTPGMFVYLPLDEGIGRLGYDRSQISLSLFNRNHATMVGSVIWSDDLPAISQLSYSAYTDENGNYRMKLPYSNAGETYELSPTYKTHEFEPKNRILFVGDASSVINEIDFTDISAFRVTGSIFYEGMTCASEDVFLKIDGQIVVKQGEPVRSDVNGAFEIEVPIGDHVITVEKNGHEFTQGRFPSSGVYNFQEELTGIEFKDGTTRKVIGRVVGGLRESNKKPGLGRSINNIGMAHLTFDPTATCGWITDVNLLTTRLDTTIFTNPNTGEYDIELPPISYVVKNIEVPSNPMIDFGVDQNLDLTRLNVQMKEVDTLRRDGTGEIISIDSVSYHKIHDYIYRSNPSLDVQNISGSGPFSGDKTYIYSHTKFGNDTINLENNIFPYPVFQQNRTYRSLISTFELYENRDGSDIIQDRVPVTEGKITIQNNLAIQTGFEIDLTNSEFYDGDTIYVFKGGRPNMTIDEAIPAYSHTKTLEVSLVTGAKSATWLPNQTNQPAGGNAFFRGYLMGIEAVEGKDFVTQGPQLVDYILRDPPGSQSFATRKKLTSTITENSWDWDVGAGLNTSLAIYAGVKFSTGLGYISPTEIVSTTQLDLSTTFSGGEGKSVITTIVNEEDWSTSDDPLLAGAASDLFLGRSYNYFMALAKELVLVPESICSTGAVDCIGSNLGGYRFGTEKNLTIAESDVQTQFVYTQNHIETNEIPQLQEIRNLFIAKHPDYTSNLPSDHPCYGFNNDDLRFGTPECPNTLPGTPDHIATTIDDYNGPSYNFNVPLNDVNSIRIDTVRLYNQQIRLWKDALARNEREKATVRDVDRELNISYSGGGSSLSRSATDGREDVTRNRFEFLFSESLTKKFGSEISGVGIEDNFSIGLTQTRRQIKDVNENDSKTIAFTIQDNSEFDDFTFDVYKASDQGGPIFKTLGGRTSCPHEGAVRSKYYQPGTLLSNGTVQLDQPEITVTPSVLYNVPQSERGIFKMKLSNNNPVGLPWEYSTQLIKNSNPNSANVNVGFSDEISGEYVIPGNASLSRDLFVEIGNGYNYDSLLIVMHSTCQYTQGRSSEKDIADSAYISIYYVPECTDISLRNPEDQWVLNNSYNDNLRLIAADYNVNHLNFESIQFEYKPANQAGWIKVEKYFKDTSATTELSPKQLDLTFPQMNHQWDVSQLPDGPYDLRAVTDCAVVTNESPVYSGYIDRINPHPFGTPSPADGILDPDDDILIKFNEDVDIGSLTDINFDVRGVLNGSDIRHETSLAFDGADDYAEIPAYQLQKRSLTLEAWVRKNGTSGGTIVSQGTASDDKMKLSMTSSGQIAFTLGDLSTTSDYAITDDKWYHVAVSYNRETSTSEIYIVSDVIPVQTTTDNAFVTDYTNTGNLLIGKDIAGEDATFNGFIHGLRLWSGARGINDISQKRNSLLSGREAGLIGSWQLTEGYGQVANDDVRGRHAIVKGATWSILPQNHAYQFDGVDDYLSANAATLGYNEEVDLTFEVWFKTSANKKQTLFSNGRADGMHPTPDAWDIYLDSGGAIVVENNGKTIATSSGWNDGDWHHFAAVIERTRAVSLYVDGEIVKTDNSAGLNQFAGQYISVGARHWRVSNKDTIDHFFEGFIDDVRIWNTARQSDQIKRDRLYQMVGDELGLQLYYPFDGIYEDVGITLRTPVLTDESVGDYNLDFEGSMTENYSLDAPPIQLPRLIEKVNFTYSLNNDEIYIELNEPAARIENTILDITVRGIRDLAGNTMPSPKTWTAYIDKNQVFWEHEYFQHEMMSGETYEISTKIVNTGGGQERYTISNLPAWMTASPSSGIIEPNSTIPVTLTIAPYVNIGSYEQDVFVSTESFGFNERLLVDLKVSAEPPAWEVYAGDYNASMNYIGEIHIEDRISTDPEDIIIAMIDDTIRGLGHVRFTPGTGKHLVFLDIFGYETGDPNDSNGKPIVFQLWDASENKVYPKVTPDDHVFAEGELRGSLSNPVPFKSSDEEEITYNLKRGWNWISFPVVGSELDSLDELFSEVQFHLADRLTNHVETVFKDPNGDWKGSAGLRDDGVDIREGYRLYLAQADTFSYTGVFKHPKDYKIPLTQGWTSIGMISEDPVDITTALASLNPQNGDWIKGQVGFAVYEDGFGWNGSMDRLSPQSSYMVKMTSRDTLIYPNIRGLKSKSKNRLKSQESLYADYQLQPEMFDYSMSMVVTIEGFDNWKDNEGWNIAAYANNKCRGVNEITMDDRRNIRLGYLQTYGSTEERLSFRLISADGTETIYLNEKHVLQSDGTLGLPSSPVVFTIGTPCLSNIDVNSNYQSFMNANKQIQAAQVIKLGSRINIDGMLRVNAGEAIELKTGFESVAGSAMELFIQPCEQ